MATQVEYAEMAGDSYISNYGLVNRFPVPQGWLEFFHVPNNPAYPNFTTASGFEAISLQNIANPNEIVISFAGTDPTSIADWTQANIPLAFGYDAAQLRDAADYYLSVQALNPNATISFTGHSLGGGLAALMAVMFDTTAVTFDQAPFANAATASVAQDLLNYLQGENLYTAAQLQPLDNFISESSATPGVIPNAANVTDTNVQGEVLTQLTGTSVLGYTVNRIGAQTDIAQQNDMSAWSVPSFALHSQALLTAFIQSNAEATNAGQTLNTATFQIADLEKMLFDTHLYANPTGISNTTKVDFLQEIVSHQDGSAATLDPVSNQPQAALPADAMVTRFTDDLWKIAQPGGLTMSNNNLTDALVAFAMDKYYNEKAGVGDAGQELYTQITGGLSFNLANVPTTDAQNNGNGYDYGIHHFNQYVSSTFDNASYNVNTVSLIESMDSSLRDWYIQAGSSAMNATDTSNVGAFMLGGAGNDSLTGGLGNNLLVAGTGNDTLNGGAGSNILIAGAGSDFLYGGQGNSTLYGGSGIDTFVYVMPATGATTETINDTNGYGNGTVYDGGTQITGNGIIQQTDNTWVDSQGDHYLFDTSTGALTINQGVLGANSGDEIVIDHFDLNAAQTNANGYLGIKFGEQLAAAASANAADDPFSNGGTYTPATQAATVAVGNVQTVTLYASAVSTTDQVISVTGGSASAFISTGADLLAFNGTLNLIIPAGQDHVTFGLVDTSNSSSVDTLNLSASLTNADGTVSSNALTVTFDSPNSGAGGAASATINGDLNPMKFYDAQNNVYYQTDAIGNIITDGTSAPNFNDTLLGSGGNDVINTGGGNNYVEAQGGNDTINAGSGNDVILTGDDDPATSSDDGYRTMTTVGAAPSGTFTNYGGNGNDVINGGGGQDVILAGNGNNQIYANSQTSLATALVGQTTLTATGRQGDLIAVGDGNNTIVGSNGNDAIFTGTGSNLIVCGPGAVSIVGGMEINAAAPNWSAANNAFFSVYGASAPFVAPANYNGSTFDAVPVGLGNDTIFGGIGNSDYWLSNGNNWLDAGGGNDFIQAGVGSNTLFGGIGNDTINGGGGNNYIDLESGNDYVVAQGGNQTIVGGSGNDTIMSGDQGSNWASSETSANNYIDGGAGNSIIDGSGGNDTLLGGTGNASIYGGNGNEYIVGGSGNVSINGGSGNDTIFAGGSGNDTLFAGDGNASVYGGDGTDRIAGGAGSDVIYAGDGGTMAAATRVYAGTGSSTLYGGAGTDQLYGGSGADTLVAGSGTSTLQGGSGTEVLYSGIGDDTLVAGSGTDTLYGGAGTDVLLGLNGTTLFVAGAGNETIIGGSGSNIYQFNNGFGNVELSHTQSGDTLVWGTGITVADLTVSATLGSDGAPALSIQTDNGGSVIIDNGLNGAIAQFTFASGATLTLDQLIAAANTADATVAGSNGDLLFGAGGSSLTGGAGNDTLYGWNGDNTLVAGTGNQQLNSESGYDTLIGGAGNDTLTSLAGNDTLIGGTGNTTFVVDGTSDVIEAQSNGSNVNTLQTSVSYTLQANLPVQYLTGTGNADITLTGNNLDNVITANNGDDQLVAGNANDTLVSGSGASTLIGGTGNDVFVVTNTADVIDASAAASNIVQTSVSYAAPANVQTLIGTGSANISLLDNSLANTTVTANSGNDTLQGGSGSGSLIGGPGLDTFVLTAGGNYTAINDASADAVVQLSPELAWSDVTAVQSGNDLLLQVAGNMSSLRIQNYFLDPQAWTFQDALGNTTTAQALLAASAQPQSDQLSTLENLFLREAQLAYLQPLVNSGYVEQSDGSWYHGNPMNPASAQLVQYVMTTSPYSSDTGTTVSLSDPYSTTGATTTSQTSESWAQSGYGWGGTSASIQQITTNATDSVIYANAGSSLWNGNSGWVAVKWGAPTPLSSSFSANYGTEFIANTGYVPTLFTMYTATYNVAGTVISGLLSSPGDLATQGAYPAAIPATYEQHQITDVIQQINVGPGDHTIYGLTSTLVNAGSGNDTIQGAGFVDAGTGNDVIYDYSNNYYNANPYVSYNTGTVYCESGNDTIYGANVIYGGSGNAVVYDANTVYGGSGTAEIYGANSVIAGSGNALIVGATTVVAGSGNDTIIGAGPGNITINPAITGMDLIGNSSNPALEASFLDSYYQSQGVPTQSIQPPNSQIQSVLAQEGIPIPNVSDAAERYQYGGLYYLSVYGADLGYYTEQDALQLLNNDFQGSYYNQYYPAGQTLQQAEANGEIRYVNPLPFLAVLQGDQPSAYYSSAQTPITATFTANDFTTLAPYFNNGSVPAETVTFGAGISLSGLQFSWGQVTTALSGVSSDPKWTYTTLDMSWGANQGIEVMMPYANDPIGSGVQEFVFADGTKMSMADMIALAPPAPTSFDFQQGMGQQILPSYTQQVDLAAGLDLSDLTLTLSGTNLMLADQGGADTLTIPVNGGFTPSLSLSLANGDTMAFAANGPGNYATLTLYDTQGHNLGDLWVNGDGTYGKYFHAADGSGTGMAYNPDGSSSTFDYDSAGNRTTESYSAAGELTAMTWSSGNTEVSTTNWTGINGSYGSVSSNAYDGSSSSTSYNADGSYSITLNDGKGNATTDDYSAGGLLTADSWQTVAGISGTDLYNADGSGSGTVKNADGSSTASDYDNSGNITTDYYSASGRLTAIVWSNNNNDVSTTSVTGSNNTVNSNSYDGSSSSTSYNADGSYSITLNDGKGNTTTDDYSAGGLLTADLWQTATGNSGTDLYNADGSGSGTAMNADGSTSTMDWDSAGNRTTDSYSAAGALTAVNWGSGNADLSTTSWTNPDGTHGSVTSNSYDGSSSTTSYHADGSYSITLNDGKGDTATDSYSASGLLDSATWADSNGASGSAAYDADGTVANSRTNHADGSYSTYNSDAQGDTYTANYSATGTLTSDSWTTPGNGNSGSATYNTDGSYSTYNLDSQGDTYTANYSATGTLTSDSWTTPGNGNSGSATWNADGSYSTYNLDAQGDTYTANYSATGTLTSDTWATPGNGNSGSATYNTDGSYSTYNLDAQGDTYTANYSATGTLTSDSWTTASNGNSGSTVYNADGSNQASVSIHAADDSIYSATTLTQADGSYQQTWSDTNGTSGSTTVLDNNPATLAFATGANTITLGSGLATLQTTGGENQINLGSGPAVLANSGATDTVNLGNVSPDQLWFAQNGADLAVTVLGSSENLTLQGWFNGAADQGTSLDAQGLALTAAGVNQLVQAMAAYPAPLAGQTSYTAQEQLTLYPLVASSWK